MAHTPALRPSEDMEDVILSQAGSYGHFAYMSYVAELRRLQSSGEVRDEDWVQARVAKLTRHVPRLLESATTPEVRYTYLLYVDAADRKGILPALTRMGRTLMRNFDPEDLRSLRTLAIKLRYSWGNDTARSYLLEYMAWAKERQKMDGKDRYCIRILEDCRRVWEERAAKEQD
jgi:hypothetical protein